MKSFEALEQYLKIAERIACPEADYPASEARYLTPAEWEKDNEVSWYEYCSQWVTTK